MLDFFAKLFRCRYYYKSKGSILVMIIALGCCLLLPVFSLLGRYILNSLGLTLPNNYHRIRLYILMALLGVELLLVIIVPQFNNRLKNRAMRNNYMTCPSCGYDCSTIPDFTACPECGLTANADRFREIWTNTKAR